MKLIKMDQVESKINKRGVEVKQLFVHENAKVMNLILKPGDIIPEHKVPVDVFFYVVEGKGTIKVGDEEVAVEERDIVLCPPNTMMSVRADQGHRFILLNVKTPSY